MEIKPSSFRIKDDYGCIVEVKAIRDTDAIISNAEIKEFFSKYRILKHFKEIDVKPKTPFVPEVVQPIQTIGLRPRPAKFLETKRLIWLVKNLNSPFGMQDFLDCRAEDFDKYNDEEKRMMWKTVIVHLRKYKLVEVATTNGERRNYKYRYIGSEAVIENELNKLKEGKVIKLEN